MLLSDFDRDQIMSFEIDHIPLEYLRDHETLGNLTRKALVPEACDVRGRRLATHDFDHAGRRDGLGTREPFLDCPDAEAMLAMAVRDVDRGQILALIPLFSPSPSLLFSRNPLSYIGGLWRSSLPCLAHAPQKADHVNVNNSDLFYSRGIPGTRRDLAVMFWLKRCFSAVRRMLSAKTPKFWWSAQAGC
jgi:hypothetical protein